MKLLFFQFRNSIKVIVLICIKKDKEKHISVSNEILIYFIMVMNKYLKENLIKIFFLT